MGEQYIIHKKSAREFRWEGVSVHGRGREGIEREGAGCECEGVERSRRRTRGNGIREHRNEVFFNRARTVGMRATCQQILSE